MDPNDTNPTVSYVKNCKDSDLYSAVFNHMEKYLVGPVSIIGFADKVFPESRIVDSSCTIKKANALVLRSPGKGMIHYGEILFEKPVFDENGNASLTALFNCGALCGNVTQYSLKKNSNKWEVQDGKLQIIF